MKSLYTSALILLLLLAAAGAYAQEYRSLNGTFNNPYYPTWGATHEHLLHPGAVGYSDGVSEPGGMDRPNPRTISNVLFSQNTLSNDPRGLSAYAWGWGQFIDHDITLVDDHATESFNISVPPFDFFFDPAGTGNAVIPMKRSAYDPAGGTDPDHPRAFPNAITAFIDGSAVYGSDMNRSSWLRMYSKGKLKLSYGGLLPFNTVTGEFAAPVDGSAPGMAMPIPFVQKWFIAGDPRANENPFLLSMHTIFAREHNRLCVELAQQHPGWSEDELFQEARRRVGALIQSVTYEEWLPTLGVHLTPYAGYKPDVNPGILNVFSAAGFRYGHTTINNMLLRMDNDGHYMPAGNIFLRDAFFNPQATMEVGGIDPYLIGMSTVVQQDFDCKVIDDLRNFLFGPPGAGGMDLVAINIQRGRERGLPDYNTLRTEFGMPAAGSFFSVTSDMLMAMSLQSMYGDINNVDPWVGLLAEDHMPDALFGPTAMAIVSAQFQALRDGDRFYYENDPALSASEKESIKNTRLADIIRRNTSVYSIHDNVFMAQPLTTSAQDLSDAGSARLEVFPNPITDRGIVLIESDKKEEALLQIIDPLGRIVASQSITLQTGSNQFPIAPEIPGIYFITLQTSHYRAQTSVLKQ